MRREVLWLVLLSLGCSASSETPSAASLWCDATCSAAHRCDGATEVNSCSSSCQSQRPQLADISVEGAQPLAACLEVMKCSDLLGNEEHWAAAYEGCWDHAKSTAEITPSVREFCKAYTLAVFDCRYWYSTEACERDFGMWSESVRDRVAACTTKPSCSLTQGCVSAIFESQ